MNRHLVLCDGDYARKYHYKKITLSAVESWVELLTKAQKSYFLTFYVYEKRKGGRG
jgi:hypothetical protein